MRIGANRIRHRYLKVTVGKEDEFMEGAIREPSDNASSCEEKGSDKYYFGAVAETVKQRNVDARAVGRA
ncbi:hypothetical protein DIE22_25375 [Burkholderia sp. Bp9142]|nr:hypothetical protein DIE22_25375 [Burkholderia sp. Bp9142]